MYNVFSFISSGFSGPFLRAPSKTPEFGQMLHRLVVKRVAKCHCIFDFPMEGKQRTSTEKFNYYQRFFQMLFKSKAGVE